MSRNCRLMILKSRAKIPSTLSMWPKLLDFCVLLFWRTNAIGLTDFATREPWGVFVCPAVFRTRFTLSRGTIPERNRGKRIAQRSMWQEKDRCRGLFLIEIQLPRFQVLEMFLCETGSEERMTRGE